MGKWQGRWPEVATTIGLVALVIAIVGQVETAQGIVALGIPQPWWVVIAYVIGAIALISVNVNQRTQMAAGRRRRVRDQRVVAKKSRRIQELEAEAGRLRERNDALRDVRALQGGASTYAPVPQSLEAPTPPAIPQTTQTPEPTVFNYEVMPAFSAKLEPYVWSGFTPPSRLLGPTGEPYQAPPQPRLPSETLQTASEESQGPKR